MVSKGVLSFPPGSVERIDVPDSDAESLWRREIGGTLQRGRRPAPRNQTSEPSLPLWQCDSMMMDPWLNWPELMHFLLSAPEAAAGGFEPPDQRHQRWPGRHQAHRARPRRRRPPTGRHSELSFSLKNNLCRWCHRVWTDNWVRDFVMIAAFLFSRSGNQFRTLTATHGFERSHCDHEQCTYTFVFLFMLVLIQ